MKKQTGLKLSLAKILFLSLSGLLALCIPLTIGMINAPPSQAHPSDDNLMGSADVAAKPDFYMAYGNPDGNNESPEIIRVKADKNISSTVNSDSSLQEEQNIQVDKAAEPDMAAEPSPGNIKASSDKSSTLKENLSDNPVMVKNGPAIVMAHSEIQTSTNTVEKTLSVEAVREPLLSIDAEGSVLLSQKETTVIVSSDEVNSGIEPEPEDADADRNQDLSDLEKPGTIPEKYNLDNEFEAIDQISTFRIESYENIDKQSLILKATYNDYYLLILQKPRFEISYGRTGVSYTGSIIIAGHDRVVMNYDTGTQYYVIEKIYKLKSRKQVTEIKERLRKN